MCIVLKKQTNNYTRMMKNDTKGLFSFIDAIQGSIIKASFSAAAHDRREQRDFGREIYDYSGAL